MPRPVAISRDQILDLKFYGWLDIGLVVAVLATFAIGTLSVGWWRRRRARNSIVEDDSEWQLYAEHEDWSRPFGCRLRRRRWISFLGAPGRAFGCNGRASASRRGTSTAAHRRAGDHGGFWLLGAADMGGRPRRCIDACDSAGISTSCRLTGHIPVAGAVARRGCQAAGSCSLLHMVHARLLEPGEKDIPLAGRYSSDDIEVMRTHVRQAAAGIDGFIVSWKSTAALDLASGEPSNCRSEQGFKLAVTYQGLDFNRAALPAARIAADLDFFADTYGNNAVFHIFGKPLVVLTDIGCDQGDRRQDC